MESRGGNGAYRPWNQEKIAAMGYGNPQEMTAMAHGIRSRKWRLWAMESGAGNGAHNDVESGAEIVPILRGIRSRNRTE